MAFPWQQGKFEKRTDGGTRGPKLPDKQIWVVTPPPEKRTMSPMYFSNEEAAREYERSFPYSVRYVLNEMVYDTLDQVLAVKDL